MSIRIEFGKGAVEISPDEEARALAELGMTASEIRFYMAMQRGEVESDVISRSSHQFSSRRWTLPGEVVNVISSLFIGTGHSRQGQGKLLPGEVVNVISRVTATDENQTNQRWSAGVKRGS